MTTFPLLASAGAASGSAGGVMEVSNQLVLLTWVAFGIAAWLLHRIAWKPILRAMEKRERDIEKSVADAARLREQTARATEEQKRILEETTVKAQEILDGARRTAATMSAEIEARSREQARQLLDQAAADIERRKAHAVASLRAEAAALAGELAARILEEERLSEAAERYTRRAAERL
jgi:F-type H+-transporting ATPase subunit b